MDVAGSAYVAGYMSSTDFPTTPGAYDTSYNGIHDAFVSKLSPNGSVLLYSTLLGGSDSDVATAIEVDTSGNAYVAGDTISANFPTTPTAYDTTYNGGGQFDGWVAKLSPTGNALAYSTFLGGANGATIPSGIDVDIIGGAYVSGSTSSASFPTTASAYDTSHNGGGYDAFATRLSSFGDAITHSTFIGGSGSDGSSGIDVDAVGNPYLSGNTDSADFPTTAGAYDTSYNGGGADAFVTKLSSSGSTLPYSTFLGGDTVDSAYSVAVDSSGSASVVGETLSSNFPTTPGAIATSRNGFDRDAFVTKLSTSGAALDYSTYLGGEDWDTGTDVAVDSSGAYVIGNAGSGGFPTTPGAYDTTFGGNDFDDAFVAKLDFLPGIEGPPGDPTCSDSEDNDGDGQTDQADPDCQTTEGPPGDPSCSDGVDNDGDGQTDGADADCVATEGPAGDPSCSDSLDNDGDGQADLADTDCQEPEGPAGDVTCSDGLDNDGDGSTDLQDTDCQEPEGPAGDVTCSDGLDNDGDGSTDLQDTDCQEPEGPAGDVTCSDGLDNDGDGSTDLQDTDCAEGPPGDPSCSDSVDNDGDGKADVLDEGCGGAKQGKVSARGTVKDTGNATVTFSAAPDCSAAASTKPFIVQRGTFKFTKTLVTQTNCFDNPAVANPTTAGFDSQTGKANGTLQNGNPATIEWTFLDRGAAGHPK